MIAFVEGNSKFFGPCLLWPNGWIDEDAAWYGSRSRPRPHCTIRGASSRERGTAAPLFSAHVYCDHGHPFQLLLSFCYLSGAGFPGCPGKEAIQRVFVCFSVTVVLWIETKSTKTKCGDALQMGSEGRYGSFYLWMHMWVAGKTVISC